MPALSRGARSRLPQVRTPHLAAVVLDQRARPLAQVLLDKLAKLDLAEEADALAVLARARGQPRCSRERTHLRAHIRHVCQQGVARASGMHAAAPARMHAVQRAPRAAALPRAPGAW